MASKNRVHTKNTFQADPDCHIPKKLADAQCREYLDEKLSEIAQANVPAIAKYISELAAKISK